MSTILVDNLTGKTSAGSITVTSEGGAATQSLQQGLAKAWHKINGTGTISTYDSFNISSIDDDGTGLYGYNFTNSMNNTNYANTIDGGWNRAGGTTVFNTGDTQTKHATFALAAADIDLVSFATHGDLA